MHSAERVGLSFRLHKYNGVIVKSIRDECVRHSYRNHDSLELALSLLCFPPIFVAATFSFESTAPENATHRHTQVIREADR